MLSPLLGSSTEGCSSLSSLEVPHLGLDAAREAAKKVKDVEFEPTNKTLDEPKEGKHDDKEHSGGDTYAGGVSSCSFLSAIELLSLCIDRRS